MTHTPEFHQNRYLRLLQSVRAGSVWLDVGSGHRLHSAWQTATTPELHPETRAGLLVGTDISPDGLRQNRAVGVRVVCDVSALPFRDGTFDLVTANMVVEHLGKPAVAFQEISRVLRRNGDFVFVTPNRRHPIVWIAATLLPTRLRGWLSYRIEHRKTADIFPTLYRANTLHQLRRLGRSVRLLPSTLEAFPSFPFTHTALEAACIRVFRLRSNIIGRLVKV